ncbi:hypothetical protein C8R46DRAFT_283614 [Mycena filopes]|nr:hypothetical protein C8R46DRAFT_283614 [Mycena filopes]
MDEGVQSVAVVVGRRREEIQGVHDSIRLVAASETPTIGSHRVIIPSSRRRRRRVVDRERLQNRAAPLNASQAHHSQGHIYLKKPDDLTLNASPHSPNSPNSRVEDSNPSRPLAMRLRLHFTRSLPPRVNARMRSHISHLSARPRPTNTPSVAPWAGKPSTGAQQYGPELLSSFHRTTLNVVYPWSTAWEDFGSPRLFEVHDTWHNLSEFDFLVKIALKIPGRIYPIAFETDCHEPRLLIRGDEDYYELDMMQCLLVRYGAGFSSADGFLAQLPLLSGVGEDFRRRRMTFSIKLLWSRCAQRRQQWHWQRSVLSVLMRFHYPFI